MSVYEYEIIHKAGSDPEERYMAGGRLGDDDRQVDSRIALSPFATWTIVCAERRPEPEPLCRKAT
jgi:hypothetical protein